MLFVCVLFVGIARADRLTNEKPPALAVGESANVCPECWEPSIGVPQKQFGSRAERCRFSQGNVYASSKFVLCVLRVVCCVLVARVRLLVLEAVFAGYEFPSIRNAVRTPYQGHQWWLSCFVRE